MILEVRGHAGSAVVTSHGSNNKVVRKSLTAQPADGADAVHLHPKASSSSDHRLAAPPPRLGLAPQEVHKEPRDRLLPVIVAQGREGRLSGRAFCDVIGRGRVQDERGDVRAEQRA